MWVLRATEEQGPERPGEQGHWEESSGGPALPVPPDDDRVRSAQRGRLGSDGHVMSTQSAHTYGARDDRELAKLAVAGDGSAFAELYDRHERRVYGFCMRMLGSQHDAADATQETFVRMLARLPALDAGELNFVAYALAAARNACYDMIEGRRRVRPVAEHPEPEHPQQGELVLDPERSALLEASREAVRRANEELPPRQREVLALRELEQLSYDDIGEIVGLNRNAVAQLISRARIRLREEMRGSALESVASASPECARALPLLAAIEDRQSGDQQELGWLREHLAACETCRVSRAAMEEAGTSYRALGAVVPLLWLRHAAIARAAEFVGADWSDIAGQGRDGARREDRGERVDGEDGPPLQKRSRRVRRGLLAAAALLATLCGVLLALLVGATADAPVRPVGQTTTAARLATAAAAQRKAAATSRDRADLAGAAGARSTPTTPVVRPIGASSTGSSNRHRRVHARVRRAPHRPAAPKAGTPPRTTPTPIPTTPAPPPATTGATPTTTTTTTTTQPSEPPSSQTTTTGTTRSTETGTTPGGPAGPGPPGLIP